jgi:uncharacterized protein YprB with RNaseH-like and TPR domain
MKRIYMDIETTGLNAYEDEITCIGLVIADDSDYTYPIKKIVINQNKQGCNEEIVLEQFNSFIESNFRDAELITWNGNKFDIPFIETRCLKYGINLTFTSVIIDLKEHFAEFGFSDKWRKPSLAETAKFLGITQTKPWNGAEAPTLFKAGLIDELTKYCIGDCEILMLIDMEVREYK